MKKENRLVEMEPQKRMGYFFLLWILITAVRATDASFCADISGFLYQGDNGESCFLLLAGTRSFSNSEQECQNQTSGEWRGRLAILPEANVFNAVKAEGLLSAQTWVSLKTLTPRSTSALPSANDVKKYWKWYDGTTPIADFAFTSITQYSTSIRFRGGYESLYFAGKISQQNQARYSPSGDDGEYKDNTDDNQYKTLCEFIYEPVDECGSLPCENGGNCTDQVNGYSCSCAEGYNGTNCETEINECDSEPCMNGGSCDDEINGYNCTCQAGFMGTNCETEINECDSAPCNNGGNCTDGQNGYECSCPGGFTGSSCETDINECTSQPCMNGGNCSDEVNKYSCTCRKGFAGPNCESVISTCSTMTGKVGKEMVGGNVLQTQDVSCFSACKTLCESHTDCDGFNVIFITFGKYECQILNGSAAGNLESKDSNHFYFHN